jgi:hypothetical protein
VYLWLLTYLLRIYAIIKTILNPHIQPFMFKYFITFFLLLDFVNPSQTKITVRFESLDFSDAQYDDYAPMPYKDGILFVSSSRTKSNYTGLFFTDFKSSPKMIEVKGEKKHVGQTFYDAANDLVYVTKSSEKNTQSQINLALYQGKINNFKIDDLEKLPFCKPQFSYGYAQIKNDKMLIHTNEYGDFALVIYTLVNHKWTDPKIIHKEKYPMLNPVFKDDKSIVFASNKPGGMGGFDLYKIVKIEDRWTEEATNFKDFNSPQDDISIIYTDTNQGYIASSRNSETSHIYKFYVE